MKDGDAAERPAGPLGEIAFELGMEGLDKGAHERDFERRTSDGAFSDDVHD